MLARQEQELVSGAPVWSLSWVLAVVVVPSQRLN